MRFNVVLLAAGGLLGSANSFIGDQVHDQFVMRGITMPACDAFAALRQADANAFQQ